MKKRNVVAAMLLSGLVLLSGCSTTRLVQTWRDVSYPDGQVKNPVVVALAQKEEVRVRIEDGFVSRLKETGVDAAPSYTAFSTKALPDVDSLRRKVAEKHYDSVLLLRLIDTEQGKIQSTGTLNASASSTSPNFTDLNYKGSSPDRDLDSTYQDFGSYYVSNAPSTASPAHKGYTYEYTLYTLEMNLYVANGEKLIWSAVTETEINTRSDSALADLVEVGMINIHKAKLFSPH